MRRIPNIELITLFIFVKRIRQLIKFNMVVVPFYFLFFFTNFSKIFFKFLNKIKKSLVLFKDLGFNQNSTSMGGGYGFLGVKRGVGIREISSGLLPR